LSKLTHPGYSEVIAKAWSDPDFKARLKADPISVLRAAGVPIPKGKRLVVVENTADVMHMVLPLPPDAADFDVELTAPSRAAEVSVRCSQCCTLDDVLTNHG
jgi:hypothetical protein